MVLQIWYFDNGVGTEANAHDKSINEGGDNTVYRQQSETKGENDTVELDKQRELKILQFDLYLSIPAYCEHTPRMKEHLDSALVYHHQEQEPFGNR